METIIEYTQIDDQTYRQYVQEIDDIVQNNQNKGGDKDEDAAANEKL